MEIRFNITGPHIRRVTLNPNGCPKFPTILLILASSCGHWPCQPDVQQAVIPHWFFVPSLSGMSAHTSESPSIMLDYTLCPRLSESSFLYIRTCQISDWPTKSIVWPYSVSYLSNYLITYLTAWLCAPQSVSNHLLNVLSTVFTLCALWLFIYKEKNQKWQL